ncbi:MAG: VWA domain-containing protein [Terrimicrobiaceae bacterium]
MKASFLFASAAWLWAIPSLAVLGVSLWKISLWIGGRRLARFISPKIATPSAAAARRRRLMEFRVTLAVLASLAVTAARPLSGPRPGTADRSGVDLVILLDVSKSMLVEDVEPSRLGAVKKDLRGWLKNSAGDRVSIVPFAGQAFVMAPLTFDYQALDFVLESAGPDSISAGGSNLPAAIDTAAEVLRNGKDSARVILLVSDGENLQDDAVAAARKAHAEDKIAILTVGVGTVQGGKVPARDYSPHSKYAALPPERQGAKGFVRNEYGTWVTSRIDERTLRGIAGAAGGRYFPFAVGSDTFRTVQNQSLRPLAQKSRAEHIQVEDYVEWFQIPLGCAIFLMAAGSAINLLRRQTATREFGVKVVQPENYSPGPQKNTPNAPK